METTEHRCQSFARLARRGTAAVMLRNHDDEHLAGVSGRLGLEVLEQLLAAQGPGRDDKRRPVGPGLVLEVDHDVLDGQAGCIADPLDQIAP